jgi:hypothetical protein
VKRETLGSEYRENAYSHFENVRAALDHIPEEFRMAAVFSIRTRLDRDGIYDRPPTKSEIAQKIEDSRKNVEQELK